MNITTDTELKVTPVKKTPWFALPLMLVVMTGIFYIGSNTKVVVTDSVDAKVVWTTSRAPNVGDYVYFQLTNSVLQAPNHTMPFVKVLRCTEGQQLSKVDLNWFCDGEFLGKSRTHSITGELLEQFEWDGPIPQEKGFVMGTHKITFDSRYWGFVDLNAVTTVEKVF